MSTESFYPHLVPFYSHSGRLLLASETVGDVCLCAWNRFSFCTLQLVEQLMRCFQRVVSPWCAERSGVLRVRWRNRQRNRTRIRVHSISMQRKACFLCLFPLGTQAKCVRSCLKCIGALTSKSIKSCPHAYCQKMSRCRNNGKSAWREHTYSESLLLHVQYGNIIQLKHVRYLMAILHFSSFCLCQQGIAVRLNTSHWSSNPFPVNKSHNMTLSSWQEFLSFM